MLYNYVVYALTIWYHSGIGTWQLPNRSPGYNALIYIYGTCQLGLHELLFFVKFVICDRIWEKPSCVICLWNLVCWKVLSSEFELASLDRCLRTRALAHCYVRVGPTRYTTATPRMQQKHGLSWKRDIRMKPYPHSKNPSGYYWRREEIPRISNRKTVRNRRSPPGSMNWNASHP